MKPKKPLLTTTTCAQCGCQIPTSLVGDAYCVKCRYHNPKKADHWSTKVFDEKSGKLMEFDGQTVEKGWLPGDAHVDFKYPDEPTPTEVERDNERDAAGEAARYVIELLDKQGEALEVGRLVKILKAKMGINGHKTDSEVAAELRITPGRLSQILGAVDPALASLMRLNNRQEKLKLVPRTR